MFGSSRFKAEIEERFRLLESQIAELKKTEGELKVQNSRLSLIVRNLARKLVSRLPISIESLEKGLHYDLIFSEEIETWKKASQGGIILDLRPHHEHLKAHLADSLNIPYDQLAVRLDSLQRDQAVLLICDNGIKSVAAGELLASKGFMFLYVLKGGMSMVAPEMKIESKSVAKENRRSENSVEREASL